MHNDEPTAQKKYFFFLRRLAICQSETQPTVVNNCKTTILEFHRNLIAMSFKNSKLCKHGGCLAFRCRAGLRHQTGVDDVKRHRCRLSSRNNSAKKRFTFHLRSNSSVFAFLSPKASCQPVKWRKEKNIRNPPGRLESLVRGTREERDEKGSTTTLTNKSNKETIKRLFSFDPLLCCHLKINVGSWWFRCSLPSDASDHFFEVTHPRIDYLSKGQRTKVKRTLPTLTHERSPSLLGRLLQLLLETTKKRKELSEN